MESYDQPLVEKTWHIERYDILIHKWILIQICLFDNFVFCEIPGTHDMKGMKNFTHVILKVKKAGGNSK